MNKAFESFERAYTSARLSFSFHIFILKWILLLQCASIIALSCHYFSWQDLNFCITYCMTIVVQWIFTPDKSPPTWAYNKFFASFNVLLHCCLYTLPTIILYPLVIFYFKRRTRKLKYRYIRGAKFMSIKEYNRHIKKRKKYLKQKFPFGEVYMERSNETRHSIIIGRPGTGKTVCISQILHTAKQSSEKAVIYDFKGDYISKFYNPKTDLIFNPLDARSLGWNLFNEIKTPMDIEAIASSLIPPSITTNDPFFINGARDLLTGIIHYLHEQNQRTNQDIWNLITTSITHIEQCLRDVKGAERGHSYIQDASSKQALGVHSTLMQYASCFEYMADTDGDFSIATWLNSNQKGMIFVSNYSEIEDTLRPILSLFIDLLGRKLLSMPESNTRRIYFMLDEFGTLQRLTTIIKLLTLSRSKGGCVFLGIQDIGQIDKLYSKEHRQSILNACGNTVIFSVADYESATICSQRIGETEYYETESSLSVGIQDFRDGTNYTQRKRKELLFLPADIQKLPELSAIVRFANNHSLISKFQFKHFPDLADPFEVREGLLLNNFYGPNEDQDEPNEDQNNPIIPDEKTPFPDDYEDKKEAA